MSTSSEMTDQQRISKVRTVVTQAGEDLRNRYPILKHQNFIGTSILVFGSLWRDVTLEPVSSFDDE